MFQFRHSEPYVFRDLLRGCINLKRMNLVRSPASDLSQVARLMVSHSAYTAPEPVIGKDHRLELWTEIARNLRAYSHSRKRCEKSLSRHELVSTYWYLSFTLNSSPTIPNKTIPCPRFSYADVWLITKYYA